LVGRIQTASAFKGMDFMDGVKKGTSACT